MAYVLGIDVGSGYCKAVVCEGIALRSFGVVSSGGDYSGAAEKVTDSALAKLGLNRSNIAYTVATGYGAAAAGFADMSMTDMSAHAYAIHHLFPAVRTVIDVGAQFSRAIRVNEAGKLTHFILNEKCAGGSGKFLQTIARILKITVSEIGDLSLTSTRPVEFTTGCAVFAESEAISRISEGALPSDILAGIHKAMASKIVSLATRVGFAPECAVTGGGAKDIGLVKAIEEELATRVMVADEPQITAAFGAALTAAEKANSR